MTFTGRLIDWILKRLNETKYLWGEISFLFTGATFVGVVALNIGMPFLLAIALFIGLGGPVVAVIAHYNWRTIRLHGVGHHYKDVPQNKQIIQIQQSLNKLEQALKQDQTEFVRYD